MSKHSTLRRVASVVGASAIAVPVMQVVGETASAYPVPCGNGCESHQHLLDWLGRFCYDSNYETGTTANTWTNRYDLYFIYEFVDPGGVHYHKYDVFQWIDPNSIEWGMTYYGTTNVLNCGTRGGGK